MHVIARSTTLASMLYMYSSPPGGTSHPPGTRTGLRSRLVGCGGEVISRMMFCHSLTVAEANRRLFWSIVSNSRHVLSRHLPASKTTNYNFRPRAHGFTLPEKDTCNFIPRMLFERIYC